MLATAGLLPVPVDIRSLGLRRVIVPGVMGVSSFRIFHVAPADPTRVDNTLD
jgi:hypothetical protein